MIGLPTALSFLKGNWKPIVVAIAFLAAWWYVDNLKDTIRDQQLTIADLTLRLDTCKDNVSTLEQAITNQNESITKALQAGREAEARIAELQGRLGQLSTEHQSEIDRILSEQTPATCEQAIQYLRDTKEIQWQQ